MKRAPFDPMKPIALDFVCSRLTEPWQPTDVVLVNDAIVRMVRLEGAFPWHVHDEDELFLCWRGSFQIEIENHAPVSLAAGELLVVRRGQRHRPVAKRGPAHAILIERPHTKQYGEEADVEAAKDYDFDAGYRLGFPAKVTHYVVAEGER